MDFVVFATGDAMAKKQRRVNPITDRSMQSVPQENDVWLTDPSPRGKGAFCGRITPSGRRLFYYKYANSNKKREYLLIGDYDPKGKKGYRLSDARLKAAEYSKLYCDEGHVDLKEYLAAVEAEEQDRIESERKEAADQMTVNELFERYRQHTLTKYADGGKNIIRLFNKDILPVIGDRSANSIRKGHITQITDAILGRGANRMAKVAFTSLKGMFKFGYNRDFVDENPTEKLERKDIGGKDVERERFLTEEEIRMLAKQIPSAGLLPTAEAAIWICLSTLCRIGELMTARWDDVDLEKGTWFIPESKNGDALTISLSQFALKQFHALYQYHGSFQWVYPNRLKSNHICPKTFGKQIRDRQIETSMSNRTAKVGTLVLPGGRWTPHDLRRTGATVMAELGVMPTVIDKCQNHRDENKVRRIYQRYNYASEMANAWKLLGERLESLACQKSSAKVIPLQSGTSD